MFGPKSAVTLSNPVIHNSKTQTITPSVFAPDPLAAVRSELMIKAWSSLLKTNYFDVSEFCKLREIISNTHYSFPSFALEKSATGLLADYEGNLWNINKSYKIEKSMQDNLDMLMTMTALWHAKQSKSISKENRQIIRAAKKSLTIEVAHSYLFDHYDS